MADTQTYYDSPLTGEELDAAFSKIPQIDTAVQQASDSAVLSQSWTQGGTGAREGENINNAKYWCNQAQTIAQGALGWYETEQALQAAHPTGQNGQWAIIGSTDTIWTWDSDTSAWVDSGAQIDLSNYYTKEQANAAFAPTSHANAETTYGAATGSLYGHVKLADTASASGASAGVAATPKCVQAAVSASLLSPTWENGFSNAGSTQIWRIANIIVCQFNIKIPTISRGAWVGILTIPGVNPGTNVNGRMPTVVAGEARDYLISTGGELRAYLNADDSGHTYNLPLVFVSVE